MNIRLLLIFGILSLLSAMYHLYLSSLLFGADPSSVRHAYGHLHSDREIAAIVSKVKLLKLHLSFYIPLVGLLGIVLVALSLVKHLGRSSGN